MLINMFIFVYIFLKHVYLIKSEKSIEKKIDKAAKKFIITSKK